MNPRPMNVFLSIKALKWQHSCNNEKNRLWKKRGIYFNKQALLNCLEK
jgi:hypothetical protein